MRAHNTGQRISVSDADACQTERGGLPHHLLWVRT
jgi:hypothetical protein